MDPLNPVSNSPRKSSLKATREKKIRHLPKRTSCHIPHSRTRMVKGCHGLAGAFRGKIYEESIVCTIRYTNNGYSDNY